MYIMPYVHNGVIFFVKRFLKTARVLPWITKRKQRKDFRNVP